MAHSFNYAILQAVPDARRGERVNIGLVVFKRDGLDIRVAATRKLSSLTARSWDAEIKAFGEIISELDDSDLEMEERHARLMTVQDKLTLSDAGWFNATTAQKYEGTVKDILRTFVMRPKRSSRTEGPSVVAEISSVLRHAKILASPKEPLDSGLVVRNYLIGDGLEADFAQLNGKLHVASVLDLRANNPQLAQAALKGVVLDQAKRRFSDRKVHGTCIFAAAPERLEELHDNLAILKPYADDVMNWEDQHDREAVRRLFYDAYNTHADGSGGRLN